MKYKVGDKVRVRSDLKVNHDYGNITLLDGYMQNYRGRIAEVIGVNGNYHLKINGLTSFYFSEEMIEGLAETKFHVYDTVKHEKFGLGTIIAIAKGKMRYRVDFDNWNEDFVFQNRNDCLCYPEELTLVEAYTGGEAD